MRSRNVIVPDAEVLRIISADYRESKQFGLLVEVAAITGARVSQLARLEVGRSASRSARSATAGPERACERRPVPITASRRTLAGGRQRTVRRGAVAHPTGRPALETLRPSPSLQAHSQARRPRAERDHVLRAPAQQHRARLATRIVPLRIVAVNHDTSVIMLERTYSKHIGDRAGPKDVALPLHQEAAE